MERNDPVWTVMGCRISGVTCCWLGESIAARDYLERGLLLYDPAHHSSYAELTVDDTHVVMLTYLAWTLLCLGYLDQARAKREAALTEARRLSRAFTLAHAISRATHAEAIVVGPSSAALHADEWVSLTERQSIGYFSAEAMIFQGWRLTMLGQCENGITQLTRGLATLRAQGLLHLPTYLTLLADAYRKAQQPQNGLRQLVEAISVIDRTQIRYYEAEMHRVRRAVLVDARRWCSGGVVAQGYQRCAESVREDLGTPRRHEPRVSLARPGQGERSARTVGSGLRVVYGRL
jgi:predicted ATPase